MRCPECDFVFSEDFDICPGCRADVRTWKQKLGLPVIFPDADYEELKVQLEQGERSAKSENTEAEPVPSEATTNVQAKTVRRTVLKSTGQTEAASQPDVGSPTHTAQNYSRDALLRTIARKTYVGLQGDFGTQFQEVVNEGHGYIQSLPQSVSIAPKLPPFEEVSWRFDQVIKELKGHKHTPVSSSKKLIVSDHLDEHARAAALNPSLADTREAVVMPVLPPSWRENFQAAVAYFLICFLGGVSITLIRLLMASLDPGTFFWLAIRDSFFTTFAIAWFLAFWPILNNNKTVGGIFIVDSLGTKASIPKLLARGMLFPPIFFFCLWPIGIITGRSVHTSLVGLRSSTVAS